MLTELRITDFAIIDQLDLQPGKGLLVFTGETGAGKSIIMDALDMLLGGKTDATAIRQEADISRVEGTFHLFPPEQDAVNEILRGEDLLDDPNFVSLSRELRREGRSTARINGRGVSLALLKEVGSLLVDIHGQSEHLSLLNVRAHLELLDRYAAVDTLLAGYKKTYHDLLGTRRELEQVRTAQREAQERQDMLTYQAEEIETAKLKPGEEETLKQERDRLANAEALAGFARQALTVLDEGSPESPAATDLVGEASVALVRLAQIDAAQHSLGELAVLLTDSLSDLVRGLRDYLEAIEYNPQRLEEVEERLDLIHRLCRKFGGSIEAVLAFGVEARRQLESISTADERIAALEEKEQATRSILAEHARSLSQRRRQAAAQMGKAIETELDDLRMASARFEVDFQVKPDPDGLPDEQGTPLAFDATGFDRVEFLIAPNPGEGPKPLARIASGGETSRLMLALKNVLARADHIPTLIFDEIDQGIGGRVGGTVGEKLWNLGRAHQVFVITHLPQLAVFGDSHYQVQKVIADGRTLTRVTLLEGKARTLELAGMLGEVTEATIRSAHDILQGAETFKKEKQPS